MLQCLPWTLQKPTDLQKQTQKTLQTIKNNPKVSKNKKDVSQKKKDVAVTLQPIEQNQKFQRE